MVASVQLLYAFVIEVHEFDEELGLIFCPLIFQRMYINFVVEMAKAFRILLN